MYNNYKYQTFWKKSFKIIIFIEISKMKIIHAICLMLLFFNISKNSFGQDPTFSQFYANPLYLSPSFAGSSNTNRFSLNYRDQWPAIPGIFNTYSVSFDKTIPEYNSGIGVLATYDVAGEGNLSTTNIGVIYTYDFNINKTWHIRPGVEFKFRYLGLDINKLIFNTQVSQQGGIPVVLPPQFDNVAGVDFASSAIAYNDNIWGGITIDHMLRPKESFYGNYNRVPIKFSLFGGWQVYKRQRLIGKEQDVISLSMILEKQDDFYQSNVGVHYTIHPLVFGVWYRGIPFATSQPGDAVIGLVGIKTKQFNIGYSYDFTISNLYRSTKGAHEISLTYQFNINPRLNKSQRMRALPCPDF